MFPEKRTGPIAKREQELHDSWLKGLIDGEERGMNRAADIADKWSEHWGGSLDDAHISVGNAIRNEINK